jgi:hypothetical protein
MASLLEGVFPLVGGPGEKPMGKTFRPLITRIWSEVTVTTEPVCASAQRKLASKRRLKNARQRRDRATAQGSLILESKSGLESASSNKVLGRVPAELELSQGSCYEWITTCERFYFA